MNGIWMLLVLIFASALPAVIVFFWLRTRKFPVTLAWFLASLAAGVISLLAAALFQNFFPFLRKAGKDGLWPVFFDVFVRIALTEETSRLFTLIPLLKAASWRQRREKTFSAAVGLVAGLGFAMLENAFYGTVDINVTLLRAFTAAPLHGACGIRAGIAAFVFRQHPVKALYLFFSAILIHGTYNLIIVSRALPSVLAVVIAFAAFFASLSHVTAADSGG